MNCTILVVDDEIRMRKLIEDFLKKSNFNVITAADGEEAYNVYKINNNIDLIILDVMMPKLDGFSVLKMIRKENTQIPIIMLTAKSEEEDELHGYKNGVDDYVTKPFSPKVLVAKVESILKRVKKEENDIIECDGIIIDCTARTVSVDGKDVEMSFREFELLKYLIENKNKALARDKILNVVWNYEFYGDSRTIDSHIKKIRKKIGKKGKNIETIRGVGYKFQIDE